MSGGHALPKIDSVEVLANDIYVFRKLLTFTPGLMQALASPEIEWFPTVSGALGERAPQYDPQRDADFVFMSGPRAPKVLAAFDHDTEHAVDVALKHYHKEVPSVIFNTGTPYRILRYRARQRMSLHVDASPLIKDQNWVLSFFAYPNDDYRGGELHFPRQNVTYKPEAGSVVVCPSHFGFPHESTPVQVGVKYTITGYLHLVLPQGPPCPTCKQPTPAPVEIHDGH